MYLGTGVLHVLLVQFLFLMIKSQLSDHIGCNKYTILHLNVIRLANMLFIYYGLF